jgi:hypothetical protein
MKTLARRRSRPGSHFDPRFMTQLELWLDARWPNGMGQPLPADGAPVSAWRDLSGKARDALQAITAKMPLFRTTKNLMPDANFDQTSGTVTTRTNMLTNPNFETDAATWLPSDPTAGTVARSTVQAERGTAALAVTGPGAYTRIAALAGRTYNASTYLRPGTDGAFGIYGASSPAGATDSGPGRRYALAKNGAGILAEEPTVNLVLNPSVEVNANYWSYYYTPTALGRVLDSPGQGLYSFACVTAAVSQGLIVMSGSLIPTGVAATGSIYIKVTLGAIVTIGYRIYDSVNYVTEGVNNKTYTGTGKWERVVLAPYVMTVPTNLGIQIISAAASPTYAITINADNAQIEQRSYATSYTDGSLGTGYTWDTTTNLVANPSFEVDAAGWTGSDPPAGAVAQVVGTATVTRQNLVPDPQMETVSGTAVVRTNMLTNPNFETDAATWLPSDPTAGTVARSTVQFERGLASLALVGSGAYSRLVATAGRKYTASAYVRPPIDGAYALYGTTSPTTATEVGPGRRYALAKNGPGVLVEEATTNLQLNPSFENGITGYGTIGTGTTIASDATTAFLGGGSAKVTATGAATAWGVIGTASFNVPAKPSTVYTVSAWVKTARTQPVVASLLWFDATGAYINQGGAAAVSVTAGKWTRTSVTVTTAANAALVTMQFYINDVGTVNGDIFWVDAVQLEEKSYATSYCDGSLGTGYTWDTTTNLCTNPSLETNTTGWSAQAGAVITRDTSTFHSGTASLKVVCNGGATFEAGLINATGAAAGNVWTVSAWIKGSAGGEVVELTCQWRDVADTSTLAAQAQSYTLTASWQRITMTMAAAPASTAQIRVNFDVAAAVARTFFVDDVQIEARAYATPYGGGAANTTTSSRSMGGITFTPSPTVPLAASSGIVFVKLTVSSTSAWLLDVGKQSTVDTIRLILTSTAAAIQVYASTVQVNNTSIAAINPVAGDTVAIGYTYDGTTLRLSVSKNGAVVSTTTAALSTTFGSPADRIALGVNPFNSLSFANAVHENVLVFNTALTQTELANILNGTTLPSAAASRSDCVFSAFVNDIGAAPQTLSASAFQRISRAWTQDKGVQTDVVLLGPANGASTPAYADSVLVEESDVLQGYFDGGTTRVPTRQNLCSNPSAETTVATWGSDYAVVARDTTKGYVGSSSARIVATSVNLNLYQISNPPFIKPSTQYTVSCYVMPDTTALLQLIPTAFAAGAVVSCPAGVWTRLSVTGTTAANATNLVSNVRPGAAISVGFGYNVDGMLIEEGAVLGAYFDGATAAVQGTSYAWTGTAHATSSDAYCPDFTYGWAGVANASVAQQKGPGFAGYSYGSLVAHRSTERSWSGLGAMRVPLSTAPQDGQNINSTVTTVVGQTYTYSAWFYVPSGSPDVRMQLGATFQGYVTQVKDAWFRLSVSQTATATSTIAYLLAAKAAIKGDDVCFIDGVQLEVGTVATPYFDGGSSLTGARVYSWAGVTNNSISNERLTPVTGTGALKVTGPGTDFRQSGLAASTAYALSAYINVPATDVYGAYLVASPTATTENAPGRRYALAKNGPGVLVEELTTNLLVNPSAEVNLTGFSVNGAGDSVTRDTSVFYRGTASARYLCGSGGSNGFSTYGQQVYCKPLTAYTFSAWVYIPPGSTQTQVGLLFGFTAFDGTVTYPSPSSSVGTVVAGKWNRVTATGTTIATTASLVAYGLFSTGSTVGSVMYIDCIQLEEKAYATTYVDGSLGTGYAWDTTTNVLSAASGSFEDGTIGGWWESNNCTLANTAATAASGTKALAVTCRAAGSMTVGNTPAVAAGTVYTYSVYVRSATIARSVALSVIWQDVNTVDLRVDNGSLVLASTTGWTRLSFTSLATPAGTVKAKFYVTFYATAAIGEVHYVDGAQIEARSYPTPYGGGGANTTTSTRSAGRLTMTLSTPIGVNSPTTLIVFTTLRQVTTSAWRVFANISDGGITNRMLVAVNSGSSNTVTAFRRSSNTTTGSLGTFVVGDTVSMAAAYDPAVGTKISASRNAAAVVVGATQTDMTSSAALTQIDIGTSAATTEVSNSPVENVLLFNTALTQTEINNILTGVTLPSAAANRADCVFSAFVNDGPLPTATMTSGVWGRLVAQRSTVKGETQSDLVIMGPGNSADTPFYLDGVQLEQRNYVTPYGGGGAHATTSTRARGLATWLGLTGGPATRTLSIAATFKVPERRPASIDFYTIFVALGQTAGSHYVLLKTDGTVQATDDTAAATLALGAISTGDTIDLVGVYTPTSIKVFARRNGAAVTSTLNASASSSAIFSTYRVAIGNYLSQLTGRELAAGGPVENCMFFNTALSDVDATAIANGTMLPSTAANRTDCLWSALVNDPGPAPTALAAGVWQRVSDTWKQDKGVQTDVVVLGTPTGTSTPTYLDSALVEESDVLQGYFDGASTRIPTRRNLIPNPNFEVDLATWSTGTFVTRDTTRALFGAASMRFDVPNTGFAQVLGFGGTGGVPCIPGVTYTMSCYAFTSRTQPVSARFAWYDTSGTLLAVGGGVSETFVSATIGTWTRAVTTVVAPAGAVFMRFGSGCNATVTGDQIWYDGFLLEAASSALTYFDGSTAAIQGTSYAWSGIAHASISEAYCPDFTYAWGAVPNASVSTQKAPALPVNWPQHWGATSTPVVHRSTERSVSGVGCLKALWATNASSSSYAGVKPPALTVGQQYTMSCSVWTPTGSPDTRMGAENSTGVVNAVNSLKDQWVRMYVTFTPTIPNPNLYLALPVANAVRGDDVCYVDCAQLETGGVATLWVDSAGLPPGETPYLDFDGIDDVLSGSGLSSEGDKTVYILGSMDPAVSRSEAFMEWVQVTRFNRTADGTIATYLLNRTPTAIANTSLIPKTVHLFCFQVDSLTARASTDGGFQSSSAAPAGTHTVSTNWVIGSRDGGTYLDGKILAVLIFSTVHDATTIKAVERWLAAEHGHLAITP